MWDGENSRPSPTSGSQGMTRQKRAKISGPAQAKTPVFIASTAPTTPDSRLR